MKPIIIGDTNFPNKNPNFVQTELKGVKALELFIPKTKNSIDNIKNIDARFKLLLKK